MKGKWGVRIGVLFVLIIFGIYLRIHKKSTSYIKRYKLLNIADSTHISGFEIVSGTDTVMLNKRDGRWMVVINGKELPANANKIENLAAKFAEAEYQVAGLNTKDIESYGINDTSSTVITVKTDAGDTKTLIMGKRGPTYSSFYFVFPEREKIYLLMGIPRYSISSRKDDYRDKSVINLKLEDIKAFTLIAGKDTLSIIRTADSFVSVPVRDSGTIKAVINRARVLTAFGFADTLSDSVTGISSSDRKIVFVTQQDDTITITVGKKGEHALYVASNKRPGEIFKVYLSWFDEVLKKSGILTGSGT